MTTTQGENTLVSTIFGSNLAPSVWSQLGWTILRVAVGLLMIHNGFSKLADVEGFAEGVVTFIGLPFPIFFTYCAAYIEILGSILFALGLFTRPAAMALLGTMFVAIYFHIKDTGFSIRPYETASLYALSYFFFLLNGAGQLSLDALIANVLGGADSES
ncbi:MAG: DoxX family protein [Leptolyngbyaceae cyanobacterium MO_188.B28]|nr:DoxX family protein [Leptolyngbyaceae cyanobacterium MO_188.B28]